MSSQTPHPSSPYERNDPRRYDVEPWRKVAYYGGAVIQAVGVLMFLSVFVSFFGFFHALQSAATSHGFFPEDGIRTPFTMFPLAFIGILLISLGQWVRGVGKKGLAGSGIILSPQGEARDAEPWKRSEGAQEQDKLEEMPIIRDMAAHMGAAQPQIRVRCPRCSYLETEDARFCSSCGSPM
ncbi:zinc ribbon domain-containing protein [Schaalia sp. 19OD2882]|uniref:zinc ribbon domain-containing protein n=1 Tax=Schaalia sp. 19OD2882 TaxID=2794089 RepID=UPI001C1EF619|nr:zinc ribbon domain-containing protein [Schaalia sp. 19OD2882]QWW19214.1 zinc ribbon domain-containing protein [Schaalia sp. 19OD2882]